MKLLQLILCLSSTIVWSAASAPAADKPTIPPVLQIAINGKALQPVVVGPHASPRVRTVAGELASYLGRMSGAKCEVATGDGSSGIAVGVPGDFALSFKPDFFPEKVTGREDYLLRTHERGAWLLGATDLAVEHAVWDFLGRLGYRQLLPGPKWEIVPPTPDLRIGVDELERPAYFQRSMSIGRGTSSAEEKQKYAHWLARNRITSGLTVAASHAYGRIMRENAAAFAAHPEYYSLIDGKRVPRQLCISNPQLRKLVADYAIRQFRENPQMDSISMEPNDGSGHCQCDECAKLGSVSDRVVLLANDVAEAIEHAGLVNKYVGLLAYNRHAQPPTIKVHPRVIVRVALYGANTGDRDLHIRLGQLAGWQKQGASVGVSEYLGTFVWDYGLPAMSKGSNLRYLKTSIPALHAGGAQYYNASLGDNFGHAGLGAYLAGRMLWDPREADHADAWVADFLSRAFGPAQEPMKAYYRVIDAGNGALLSEDMVGRMYRALQSAQQLAGGDAAIQGRLDDLILYTRYVELMMKHRNAEEGSASETLVDVMRHLYRMRESSMVDYKSAASILITLNKKIERLEEKTWKSETPFGHGEIDSILAAGIAANKLLDFQPVQFSEDLVPAGPLKLASKKPGTFGNPPRVHCTLFTWLDQPGELQFKARGKPGRLGTTKTEFNLYASAEVTDDPVDQHAEVFASEREYNVTLKSPHAGLHWLDAFVPTLDTDFKDESRTMTMPCRLESPFYLHIWSLYFYVPRGAKVVGGFTGGQKGKILDSDGKTVFNFDAHFEPGYFSVPVPPGQDGKLWLFDQCRGKRVLMTVPPYLARDARQLLLPREVVTKDAG